MRTYNSSSPYPCSKVPLSTTISKPNSRGFPEDTRMTSSHIPTQSSSRHPRKGCLPRMSNSKERLVTELDAGIVPSTALISRRTADPGASHLILAYNANTRRRESPLRFTSPLSGSCSSCEETCQICFILLKTLHLPGPTCRLVRYNSSSMVDAASRIGCSKAISALSWGDSVRTRNFDQRTTGV